MRPIFSPYFITDSKNFSPGVSFLKLCDLLGNLARLHTYPRIGCAFSGALRGSLYGKTGSNSSFHPPEGTKN